MNKNWQPSFERLIETEGGFTNDQRDQGNHLPDGREGSTNLGVTQKNWEAYVGHKVTQDDMRNLTPSDVNPFYKKLYWDSVRGDDLPSGVDYAVFDFGVNSGAVRAIEFLQRVVGVTTDGILGPDTLSAVNAMDASAICDQICDDRLAYLKNLDNWDIYGKGWINRVEAVKSISTSMVG